MLKVRAGMFVLLACVVAPLGAQSPGDSVTFRRGQWGSEFGASPDFLSIGALRFGSARDAWVLNAEFLRRTNDVEGPSYASEWEDRRGRLFVGRRWYRPVVSRVFQHISTGVFADGGRGQSESGPRRERSRMYGGGLLGEIGGTWLATSHVSLGASWLSRLGYVSSRTVKTSPPDPLGPCQAAPCPDVITRHSSTYLQLGEVNIRVALYY